MLSIDGVLIGWSLSMYMYCAGCGWGGLCILVGIMKCCFDRPTDVGRTTFVWTVSGLIKITTTLVVYNTPHTAFHLLCCTGCILGLAIATIGTLWGMTLHSVRESSEMMMFFGSVISFASMVIKGFGCLLI